MSRRPRDEDELFEELEAKLQPDKQQHVDNPDALPHWSPTKDELTEMIAPTYPVDREEYEVKPTFSADNPEYEDRKIDSTTTQIKDALVELGIPGTLTVAGLMPVAIIASLIAATGYGVLKGARTGIIKTLSLLFPDAADALNNKISDALKFAAGCIYNALFAQSYEANNYHKFFSRFPKSWINEVMEAAMFANEAYISESQRKGWQYIWVSINKWNAVGTNEGMFFAEQKYMPEDSPIWKTRYVFSFRGTYSFADGVADANALKAYTSNAFKLLGLKQYATNKPPLTLEGHRGFMERLEQLSKNGLKLIICLLQYKLLGGNLNDLARLGKPKADVLKFRTMIENYNMDRDDPVKIANKIDSSAVSSIGDILITGHSLGGAVATLFAIAFVQVFPKLASRVRLITFEAPRSLKAQTIRALDRSRSPEIVQLRQHSIRVVNEKDPVPLVPFNQATMPASDYQHFGNALFIPKEYTVGDYVASHGMTNVIETLKKVFATTDDTGKHVDPHQVYFSEGRGIF